MPSAQVTLTGGTISTVPITNPTGRIVVTMISNAAETYATCDGSNPVTPTSTPNTSTQTVLPPVAGAQIVLVPNLPGSATASTGSSPGGAVLPEVNLLSAGTPVIEVAW